MIYPSRYKCIEKPGSPVKAAGFFVCLLLVAALLLPACSGARKLSGNENGQELAGTASSSPVSGLPLKGSLQAGEIDSVFFEGVKAKMLGDNDKALAAFRTFSAQKPLEATGHYEIARLIVANYFNPTSALDEMKQAVALDSTNKWISSMYGDLLSYAGRYEEAANIFGRLAAAERNPDEFRLKQALLYQKAGKWEQTLSILDSLERRGTMEEENIILFRQQVYESMGNKAGALAEIEKLSALYPEELRYLLLLAEALEKNGRKDEAAKVIDRIEAEHADEPDAQYVLLAHFLDRKDVGKIKDFFKRAMKNRGLDREEKNNLLVLLIQYERSDPSVEGFTEQALQYMAEQEPQDVEAIALYADFLSVSKKTTEALAEYKKLVAVDSNRQEVWLQIMYNYATPAGADSLVYYGTRAVKQFAENGMAQYLLGLGYQFKGESAQAAAAMEKAIVLQPAADPELKAQMYVLLGDSYHNLGNHAASDSAYDKALKLQPENASALNNYSYYLSERDVRLDDAAKMSALSLKLQPGEATFLDTYGWILYRQGNYREARKYIQEAIDKSQNPDATLWEHLGDIEFKLNNKTRALELWRKAKAQGGASEQIEEKIEQHEQ